MRELPILFNGPMVRSVLDGSKTQTRRVAKLAAEASGALLQRSPYGAPGDRLWVREAWQADPPHDGTWASTAWAGSKPHALSEIPERFRHPRFCLFAANWLHGPIRWRPSIHMPRWASRITLEVTGVRVERLQEISRGDAMAEGCPFPNMAQGADPRDWYRELWESINGVGSWGVNSWVWVIGFRRLS